MFVIVYGHKINFYPLNSDVPRECALALYLFIFVINGIFSFISTFIYLYSNSNDYTPAGIFIKSVFSDFGFRANIVDWNIVIVSDYCSCYYWLVTSIRQHWIVSHDSDANFYWTTTLNFC